MYRVTSILMTATLTCSGCGILPYMGQQESASFQPPADYMSESVRQSIHSVDVVADTSELRLRISGDYGQETMTVGEGVKEGLAEGAGMTGAMVVEDPRMILLAPIVLPVWMIAGSIAGAAAAKFEQQVQEFRDNLADDIEFGNTLSISAETIAAEVESRIDSAADIRRGGNDANADLVIILREIEIATEEKDATISASATAVLRSKADGTDLYRKTFDYIELDSLKNWANGDDLRWSSYTDNANGYLGAEIVSGLFQTIHVRNVLRPVQTETFSGGWRADVESATPTLAWELFLLGGDYYRDRIDRADIRFQLRIFDEGRLVYEARNIEGSEHTVSKQLPACRLLRWTVRPVYRVDGHTRVGQWMRYRSRESEIWDGDTPREFWAYYPGINPWCKS